MKVNDDILLAQGRNATIMAYSANSGKLLWQNRFTNDYWIEDMGIFDNSLYVARHSTYLTAYNLNDGEILWSQRVPDRTSLFVFPDRETVYLGTSDSLRSYGVKTYDGDYLGPGRLLWEYSLDGLVDYMEKVDDTIYIAYYQDEGISFSAMDIKTFESKWNISYRQIPGILSIRSMVIENDVLYATGDKIVAIATQNGKVLWASERKAAYKKSIISGNVIYAIDRSYLYTLDKNTGVEMGRVPLPGLPSLISFIQGSYTNLFINDDLVIIVSNGQVYCYPRSVL
jgi:outer membrane protein assembly factor BamB